MAAHLPRGLAGMYQHVMKTLYEALQAERPDMLLLLRERLLPVLVAARDSLTVEQLGITVGVGVGTSSTDVRGRQSLWGSVMSGCSRAVQQGARCGDVGIGVGRFWLGMLEVIHDGVVWSWEEVWNETVIAGLVLPQYGNAGFVQPRSSTAVLSASYHSAMCFLSSWWPPIRQRKTLHMCMGA